MSTLSKYRLSRKEQNRRRHLLLLFCAKRISPAEETELDKLEKRATKLLWQHPKFVAVRKRMASQSRKLKRLVRRLDAVTGRNDYEAVWPKPR